MRGGQYSFDVGDLNEHGICDEDTFLERVCFENVDMNHIDKKLSGYDFVYSSCALEHLGSLEKGLTFINNSLNCLKSGGIAVHTTEFNVSSNSGTIEDGATVIYRKKDIIGLAKRLTENGHKIVLNFVHGKDEMNQHYDVPPYFQDEYHLKLLLDKYIITSIGLIIHKA